MLPISTPEAFVWIRTLGLVSNSKTRCIRTVHSVMAFGGNEEFEVSRDNSDRISVKEPLYRGAETAEQVCCVSLVFLWEIKVQSVS